MKDLSITNILIYMLITLHNVKIRMSNVATESTTRKFNF